MTKRVPPRLYCIPATEAPVIAVFRRGPSDWSCVGRWDLEQGTYDSGAWLRGRLFPRRSALSPNGRFLCYFAHNPKATWVHGETYVAISKLPWLSALHAFSTCGTWTRGYYFTEGNRGDEQLNLNLPIPYGLRPIPVVQFANERLRGWQETPDSPSRHPEDVWDERRNAQLSKQQPGGYQMLYLQSLGQAGGEFGVDQAVDGMSVLYSMKFNEEIELLDDLQWADWDAKGQLLVATRTGQLQVRNMEGERPEVVFEVDLSIMEPNPIPAPHWAQHW